MVLALLLTVVPIVVMSFAKDKVERYLLPVAAPAAVLAAGALVDWVRSDRRDPRGKLVEAVHWITLAAFAVAPLSIALAPGRFGVPAGAFDVGFSAACAAEALVLLAAHRVLRPRRQSAGGTNRADAVTVAVLTAVVVLIVQYPVIRGYSRMSTSDLKPLADVVWAQYPDAALYEYEPGTRTRTYLDLPIYAGRLSRKVNDPAALAPAERPQVVVFFQRKGEPPALPPPWKELAEGGGRKDRWRAFVLPAKK
jgi:4-amino-4-deoxy-L-arabinose transferase-like glycosyltransferase